MQNQNRDIANHFERERLQREKEEREIQRICEVSLSVSLAARALSQSWTNCMCDRLFIVLQTSEELKDLEKRLQIGYVNKERAAQHQEHILMQKMER